MLAEVSMVSRSASVGWELVNGESSGRLSSLLQDIGGMMTCSLREADTRVDSAKGKIDARRCGRRMVMRIWAPTFSTTRN